MRSRRFNDEREFENFCFQRVGEIEAKDFDVVREIGCCVVKKIGLRIRQLGVCGYVLTDGFAIKTADMTSVVDVIFLMWSSRGVKVCNIVEKK